MRMERIAVAMPHSTAKAFRRYAQVHDLDLCIVAKEAVTEMCRTSPAPSEVARMPAGMTDRVFVSIPDTAMRLLELWSDNTGIPKARLMEWSIRKFTEKKEEDEEGS